MTAPAVEAGIVSPLALRLASHRGLAADDLARIDRSLGPTVLTPANSAVAISDTDDAVLAIVEGWVSHSVAMIDGRRQIVAVTVTGELLDLAEARASAVTLTAVGPVRTRSAKALQQRVAGLPADRPLAQAWNDQHLARRASEIRHLVRLRRMSAYERMADFLLDISDRLQAAGVATGREMRCLFTQEMLADHLGLSNVHVNRTLQELRRERLIHYGGGVVRFPDRTRLQGVPPNWA